MPLNLQVHPKLEEAEPMVRAFFQDTLLDLAVVVQRPFGFEPFEPRPTTEPFKIILAADQVSDIPRLIDAAVKKVQRRWIGWENTSSWLIRVPNSGLNPKVIESLSVLGAATRILLSGHGNLWDTDNFVSTPISRPGRSVPPLLRHQQDPPSDPTIFTGKGGRVLPPELPLTEETYQVIRADIAKNKVDILRYQHQIMTVVVDKLSDPEFMKGFEIREEV